MRNRIQNSLLVEIMMALLFFALSAAVLLPVYVTAHESSREAERLNEVLLTAQNLADESYAARDVQSRTLDCGSYTLHLTVSEHQQPAGMLRSAVVTAVDSATGQTLLELPCLRYLPDEEGTP